MTATQDLPKNLTVAVVGSTGQQGGAVAQALLAAGVRVRALTRRIDSPAAQALVAAGAHVVAADLDDPDSVRAAFAGVDAVFAMATMAGGGAGGELEHGRTIAQAAKDTQVGHVVYSSVGGAERHTGIPHFDSKREIELRLLELDVPTSILRPVYFMENLLGATSVEEGQVVVRQPLPDHVPLQLIAVGDIGRAAASLLLDPTSVGSITEIGGDERTGSQMAEAFGRFAGLPARYEALPLSVLGGNEDLESMFRWFADSDAYHADWDRTRALVGEVKDLSAWVPTSGWSATA